MAADLPPALARRLEALARRLEALARRHAAAEAARAAAALHAAAGRADLAARWVSRLALLVGETEAVVEHDPDTGIGTVTRMCVGECGRMVAHVPARGERPRYCDRCGTRPRAGRLTAAQGRAEQDR